MLLTLPGRTVAISLPRQPVNAFAVIGFVEILVGLAGALVADYAPAFYVLTLIAGPLGVLSVAQCVMRPRTVKVYDVSAASLTMAYGTGTLISLVSFYGGHQDLLQLSVVSPYWLTRSLALAVAACGVLHLFARLIPGGLLFRDDSIAAAPPEGARLLWLVGPVLLLFAGLIAAGQIGFMGQVSSADNGGPQVSPVALLATALATPVGALALHEALRQGQRYRKILLLSAGMLLLMQFGLGRRLFLFALITYAMGVVALWKSPKLFTWRNLAALAACLLLLQVASTSFYALRMATWTLGKGASSSKLSIIQLIPRAYTIWKNDRNGDLEANIRKNVKTRTFVLEYLAQISEGESIHGALFGEDGYRALVVATPSALYPEKFADKYFLEEESLINPRFGLPIWDAPNSVFIAGMADLGVPGMFIYPLLLSGAFAIALAVMRRGPPAALLFTAFSAAQILLTSEADIAGYLAAFRSMVLTAGAMWLFFGGLSAVRAAKS